MKVQSKEAYPEGYLSHDWHVDKDVEGRGAVQAPPLLAHLLATPRVEHVHEHEWELTGDIGRTKWVDAARMYQEDLLPAEELEDAEVNRFGAVWYLVREIISDRSFDGVLNNVYFAPMGSSKQVIDDAVYATKALEVAGLKVLNTTLDKYLNDVSGPALTGVDVVLLDLSAAGPGKKKSSKQPAAGEVNSRALTLPMLAGLPSPRQVGRGALISVLILGGGAVGGKASDDNVQQWRDAFDRLFS